jgi:hypothetical protein
MTVFYVEACIADKVHVLLRADVVGSSRKFKDDVSEKYCDEIRTPTGSVFVNE